MHSMTKFIVHVSSLDLRKAFDTMCHVLLFKKLEHYGFRGPCLDYLKSYYQNRKQYVYSNGFSSESSSVVCGVPQGSILGPICFSLNINDMPFAVKVDVVLFADNAAFHHHMSYIGRPI